MDSLTLRRLAVIVAALLVGGLVAAFAADAQDPPGPTTPTTTTTTTPTTPTTPSTTPTTPKRSTKATKLVTYAARVCNSYTDVTANLARNDIQESLRDLGADTLYTGGEPISPAKEAQGQPNCRPLPNWVFVLGTGFQTRAVNGSWGSLSKVLSPYGTSIVTQNAVPLLDAQGKDTGQSLRGAVTVALTEDQADRAATSSSLWLQGGTPTDPVLDQTYPGQYGFAALRCALDDLNGDNVEWIGFPSGTDHVFCYAYYVQPPPTSGTIIVRKVVDDPSATAPQTFTFSGNISYTSDHRFSLTASNGSPAQETFYRGAVGAGDPPWDITEELPSGWTLKGLDCVSADGTSTSTTDLATGKASVTLAANDTVTCTYTNTLQPPPAGLQLGKRTIGGVGSFDFSIAGPDSGSQTIATTAEVVWTGGAPLSGTAGSYQVTEQAPADEPAGSWKTTQVVCNGAEQPATGPATVTIPPGEGATCGFTNTFVPGGSIIVRKTEIGRAGDAGFTISRIGLPAASYEQTAKVRREDNPTLARGDDTTHVPLGTYRITEIAVKPPKSGAWRLQSVICNGRPITASKGQATVRLTNAEPKLDCTFTNRYDPDLKPTPPDPVPPPTPAPPTPTPPTPTPTPPTPDNNVPSTDDLRPADGPFADLTITKSVTPSRVRIGDKAHYEIVVVNRGPDPAQDVVVTEVQPRGSQTLKVHTTKGTCVGTRPASCSLGTLQPGERVVITTNAAPERVGRLTNRVATVSSTSDPDPDDNEARATVRVLPPAPDQGATSPAFTG
jgi:uncharacterized repeat protein (TIGR01451 family)